MNLSAQVGRHRLKQALETDDPVDPAFFIHHRQGSQPILDKKVRDIPLFVVKSSGNHSLDHDGFERCLGIAGQQLAEIDSAHELALLVLHIDIVDDIEVARFTPQNLKSVVYSRVRGLREKTGGHHTAGRLLVMTEEASDILCRLWFHFLKECLGVGLL
jgi:hypothetical protein